MRITAIMVAEGLLAAAPAWAQGVWFDIGSGRPSTIHCRDDTLSWIEFAPYPFGESWPRGTQVYAELVRGFDPNLAARYSIRFSDGGCACGTDLLKPIAFRLHYSEAPRERASSWGRVKSLYGETN